MALYISKEVAMRTSGVPTRLTHPQIMSPTPGALGGGGIDCSQYIFDFPTLPLQGEAAMGLFMHGVMGQRQVGPVPAGVGIQASSPSAFVSFPLCPTPCTIHLKPSDWWKVSTPQTPPALPALLFAVFVHVSSAG